MAVNVSLQYNRVTSPRQYTVDSMLLPAGSPFKCHENILSSQTMIPPNKRFDMFLPVWDAQKV